MAKQSRSLVAVVAIALGTVAASTDAAQIEPKTVAASAPTRVRSSSPSLVALIREATERSATFRALVKTIEATDGIVYVEQGPCRRYEVQACLVGVTAAGANRVVWLKVDARKVGMDLAVAVGHELRHAIEVLVDSDVTSTDAMYSFYLREARRGTTGAFETDAAVQTGNAVRSEMRRRNVRPRLD